MTGTTTNQRLTDWVDEWVQVLEPADVHWCDGTPEEYEELCAAPGRERDVHAARRGEAPEQLLGPLRPR